MQIAVNFKNDLVEFIDELSSSPELGINLGENIFKVKVPNSSIPTRTKWKI